jgi:hypothetical protein
MPSDLIRGKARHKNQAPLRAPDTSRLPSRTSAVDVMMAEGMMAPAALIAPAAIAADEARAMCDRIKGMMT